MRFLHAAIVVFAAGLLMAPPVHAQHCRGPWVVPAYWQISQSNGIFIACRVKPTEVRDRPHARTHWVHKGTCYNYGSGVTAPAELIVGGIKGTTDYTISMTVEWSAKSSGYYSGVLDERTRSVTKGFTFDQKDSRNRATWTADPLSC